MRQQKSLSGPSAGYYRRTKPRKGRYSYDSKILPASRSSDNDVAREMRQQQVRDLLQGRNSTIAQEIIQDIRVEGSPEETELVLLGESRQSLSSAKTTVDGAGVTVAIFPAETVEERTPKENAGSRLHSNDDREDGDSIKNPTSEADDTNRERTLSSVARLPLLVKGIMEMTCEGHVTLCEPANCGNPRATTTNDVAESLKKSVSWRDDVIDKSKEKREQVPESFFVPPQTTQDHSTAVDAKQISKSNDLSASSSIQSGADITVTPKRHGKPRNKGFRSFFNRSKSHQAPKQEASQIKRELVAIQLINAGLAASPRDATDQSPGDTSNRPYTTISPIEGDARDNEIEISAEVAEASKGCCFIETYGQMEHEKALDLLHVPQSDRETEAVTSPSTTNGADDKLQKRSLIEKEILELRKDLYELKNTMMNEIGKDLERIVTCTQMRYDCSNQCDGQHPDDLGPLAQRMDTVDEWTVYSMRVMSGSEMASMEDDANSVILSPSASESRMN